MIGERFRDLASFAATPRRRQCGATLLEIAVAVVIFTALIGAAFTVVLRSQDHIFDEVNLITLNDKLSRTVARLAEDTSWAILFIMSMTPPLEAA